MASQQSMGWRVRDLRVDDALRGAGQWRCSGRAAALAERWRAIDLQANRIIRVEGLRATATLLRIAIAGAAKLGMRIIRETD
ncbi:hypothetical protein [Bradyrhizobium sp.]|uniref:hypothetical protein n=1 Tax=Bradyrhizobium sp. TaxID=376 RepID=UPI003C376AF7